MNDLHAHPRAPVARPASRLFQSLTLRRALAVGLVWSGGLSSCPVALPPTPTGSADSDGDGVLDWADCAPFDAEVFPGAVERLNDGVDQNCDGADGHDLDRDGFSLDVEPVDCNDADPTIHPGAVEPDPADAVDHNCDRWESYCDEDRDGFLNAEDCGGTDCDDRDPGVGAPGTCVDQDGDGVYALHDCDDQDACRFPGNLEACDGVDNDCDCTTTAPRGEVDHDGDGSLPCLGPLGPCAAPGLTRGDPNDCDDTVGPQ